MKSKKEKEHWFKAKLYGWGWYPVTKEGWIVTIGFLIITFAIATVFSPKNPSNVVPFVAGILLAIVALLIICYKTGETPRWRWGK